MKIAAEIMRRGSIFKKVAVQGTIGDSSLVNGIVRSFGDMICNGGKLGRLKIELSQVDIRCFIVLQSSR